MLNYRLFHSDRLDGHYNLAALRKDPAKWKSMIAGAHTPVPPFCCKDCTTPTLVLWEIQYPNIPVRHGMVLRLEVLSCSPGLQSQKQR